MKTKEKIEKLKEFLLTLSEEELDNLNLNMYMYKPTFEQWLKINNYTENTAPTYCDENGNVCPDYELIKEYNEEIMDL